MAHTTTIYTSQKVFKAVIDFEKETTHPDSPLRVAGCLTDERVPPELVVYCSKYGAISVYSKRPENPQSGAEVQKKIAAKFSQTHKSWIVALDPKGVRAMWYEGWVYVPCCSRAHCLHVINLLSGGKVPSNINPTIV